MNIDPDDVPEAAEPAAVEQPATSGPTRVRKKWFPASVIHPELPRRSGKTFVILAEGGEHHGLWVYTAPDLVAFHAPINWLRQPALPVTDRVARNGVSVFLTDGTTAVITPGGGCRCGQLGRWAGPTWARTVTARS
jgi:hypothetical protein